MINRELIRLKIVQLTYAYYQNGNRNMDNAEKELLFSLSKAYDMYNILKNNTSEADFNIWATAYQKAVPYYRNSTHWLTYSQKLASEQDTFDGQPDDCGALSMFFPHTSYKNTSPNWNTAIQQFQWNNALRWQQYGW